jgi:hypothetical protein
MVEIAVQTGLWPLIPVFTVLLGVYLLVLGLALAGLVTALKKREADGKARNNPGQAICGARTAR